MPLDITRRNFISKAGLAVLTLPLVSWIDAESTRAVTVPGLKLGYSAITWGGNDVQAIKDISSLGFKGIQLRANVLKEYSAKPEELRQLLTRHKLELPMFSSGDANINTGDDEAVIQEHVSNAEFVKSLGGSFLQVTNSSRPREGSPSTADLKSYGQLLNEIGKRTRDLGVQAVYHNHMHQLGETPQEVGVIMESCDAENVQLLLDVAHYHQGGGDPAKAIVQYRDRLKALHLKDVQPKPEKSPAAYTFVELGQGKVDLPSVFNALKDIQFKGWGVVELDAVPDKNKSPLQCAQISRAYLKSAGLKL